MGRKTYFQNLLSAVFLTFYFSIPLVWAAPVTSTELISNAGRYNGETVVFEGEIIGDIMLRGSYAWINVNDGNNALGVWVKNEMLRGIRYGGSYSQRGDKIEVIGLFNRSCIEHGGDIDIHASSVKVIQPGGVNIRELDQHKKQFVKQAFIVLVIVWILSLLKIRRKKKF